MDVWESTRQENERRKAEKHRLLDQILVAMHTDGMMASFMENSTLPDQSNNNSFLGSAAAVMRSERNSISPFSPTICSNNPQVGQELLDVIQEIASLDEGEREVVQEGDAPPTAAAPAAEEESGSEIESLLSAGAEQLAVLPAVRTTGARNPRASHIPALFIEEHPEQVAASPDPLTGGVASTGMSRLEERNWIENGELDEEMIHDLWDEAFSSVQSDSMFGTVHRHEGNQHNSLTAWLKPVPEAKRHPTSNAHLEGMSPKKPPAAKKRTPQKGNTSPQAGDYTTEATATGTALPRNLTAALLCEPVKYEDASSKFFVAPPVSLERAREGMGMGTAEEARRRSLTLPAIGSAARNKGTAAAPSRDFGAQLGVNKDTSGLEVTEEGLVLRDPLMGKKFAQQRKAIVAQAMKASAALKRSASASEGVQKSATMSALSQSSEILPSSMPKKKNVHALSSSAVALKSAI